MTVWQYHSEWWTVDYSQPRWVYTPPPQSEALGQDGWELVSVTAVPLITSETGSRGQLTGVTTQRVSYQAFYKRPVG